MPGSQTGFPTSSRLSSWFHTQGAGFSTHLRIHQTEGPGAGKPPSLSPPRQAKAFSPPRSKSLYPELTKSPQAALLLGAKHPSFQEGIRPSCLGPELRHPHSPGRTRWKRHLLIMLKKLGQARGENCKPAGALEGPAEWPEAREGQQERGSSLEGWVAAPGRGQGGLLQPT